MCQNSLPNSLKIHFHFIIINGKPGERERDKEGVDFSSRPRFLELQIPPGAQRIQQVMTSGQCQCMAMILKAPKICFSLRSYISIGKQKSYSVASHEKKTQFIILATHYFLKVKRFPLFKMAIAILDIQWFRASARYHAKRGEMSFRRELNRFQKENMAILSIRPFLKSRWFFLQEVQFFKSEI